MRFFTQEVLDGLERSRKALGRFVGARADDLVFVNNATAGVATILASLALEPEDEILVNDHEYGACIKACEKTATVRKVNLPLPTTAGEIVERLESGIGPRTRLALLSHVTSPTGLVFPLPELLEVFERRGVPLLVDGAHAPGMIPMELQAWADLGLRYYTANLHKWTCAPKGTAFLWIREDVQPRIHPLVTSHGHDTVWPRRTPFTTRFDWTGTDDPSPFLVVPEVLEALALLHPGGLGRAESVQSKPGPRSSRCTPRDPGGPAARASRHGRQPGRRPPPGGPPGFRAPTPWPFQACRLRSMVKASALR